MVALAARRPGLVLAPNSPELVVSMFAVWQAGGVLVPVDQQTMADVVQRIRALSEPSLLIALAPLEGLDDLPTLTPESIAGRAGDDRGSQLNTPVTRVSPPPTEEVRPGWDWWRPTRSCRPSSGTGRPHPRDRDTNQP